jgi:hypothetical protein
MRKGRSSERPFCFVLQPPPNLPLEGGEIREVAQFP